MMRFQKHQHLQLGSAIAISAAFFLLVVCATIQMAAGGQLGPVVGGLTDERAADASVLKLMPEVKAQLEQQAKQKYKSLEPISYRSQTVAGVNFYIKALVKDENDEESHMHLKVYRPINNVPELAGFRANQPRDARIEYF